MTASPWSSCAPSWPGRHLGSGYDETPVHRIPASLRPPVILYEYPFNERIRTYLRLEQLFKRLGELVPRAYPLDHHYAIQTIFEIMDVASRADMKSDVLKDIDRQKLQLNSYRGNPAISEAALDAVIAQLDGCFSQLSQLTGKTGQSLTENDWLMSIRSRIGIPGGTCEFDLPAYFDWQHHPTEHRQADLERWVAPLAPLAESIGLLLKMLRDSGSAQKVVAPSGQFQQNLPQGRTFQLLRLRLDPSHGWIPEISGNRLMVSVRLMRRGDDDRLHPAQEDGAFELTLCWLICARRQAARKRVTRPCAAPPAVAPVPTCPATLSGRSAVSVASSMIWVPGQAKPSHCPNSCHKPIRFSRKAEPSYCPAAASSASHASTGTVPGNTGAQTTGKRSQRKR